MERNSEANENQTAPPDNVLENAELPAEAVEPPAEDVEPPAEPAEPAEPPALAEEPLELPEEPEFAATSETKLETASEETGSKTDSEKQKTSKGSETDVQSKVIPEVTDEKALKKARRKAQRKGFFSKFDEHNDIEEEEMSECEYETDYADSFLDSKLITTNSELEDKLGSDFELSYKPLDDQEIETLLKSDREDGSDELDYKLESKQDTKDTVQMKDTFLKHFEIPSLSDISEEQEIEVKTLRSSKRKVASNSNTITPAEVGNVNESTHSSISEDSSKGSDGLDNLPLSHLGSLINVTAPRKAEFADEDAFIMFKDSILAGEFDDDRESIKHQLQLLTITMDFIQELLHKVVTESEKKEKQDSLTYKLNMVTMYDTLKEDVQSLRLEKETCNFLNSRMVDYYKRLKNFRLIKALPENLIIPEYQRYMEALKWLDHVLNVAKETKRKVSFLMSSVLMDLTYVQNIMMDTEEHLQNIVLKLIGKRSEYLHKVAERELKLIEKKRNEISDERMFLLTRKHTLAQITHKMDKLQKVGDGIYMDDFISVQNQVLALEKKLDEKNVELKRLRFNYHMDLHLTLHNHEKTLSLVYRLEEEQRKLKTNENKQQELRETLYKVKFERSKIRKEIKDFTYHGGLLAMPLLMHDYDRTVEQVAAKQKYLKMLKETVRSVIQRIAEYEGRCA